MMDLGFLVLFPCLDQACSSVVTQINASARHVDEAVWTDLPPTNQGHDESISQRAQLFSKVKSE